MPIERSNSAMQSTSLIWGTLCRTYRPSAKVVAAISFSTEFLAPPMGTRPDSGPLRCTMMRSTTGQYGRHPSPPRPAPGRHDRRRRSGAMALRGRRQPDHRARRGEPTHGRRRPRRRLASAPRRRPPRGHAGSRRRRGPRLRPRHGALPRMGTPGHDRRDGPWSGDGRRDGALPPRRPGVGPRLLLGAAATTAPRRRAPRTCPVVGTPAGSRRTRRHGLVLAVRAGARRRLPRHADHPDHHLRREAVRRLDRRAGGVAGRGPYRGPALVGDRVDGRPAGSTDRAAGVAARIVRHHRSGCPRAGHGLAGNHTDPRPGPLDRRRHPHRRHRRRGDAVGGQGLRRVGPGHDGRTGCRHLRHEPALRGREPRSLARRLPRAPSGARPHRPPGSSPSGDEAFRAPPPRGPARRAPPRAHPRRRTSWSDGLRVGTLRAAGHLGLLLEPVRRPGVTVPERVPPHGTRVLGGRDHPLRPVDEHTRQGSASSRVDAWPNVGVDD